MQTIGKATLRKLRSLYRAQWSREWPHDDGYLHQLWNEARGKVPMGAHRVPPEPVWRHALSLMRECHEIPAGAPSGPAVERAGCQELETRP